MFSFMLVHYRHRRGMYYPAPEKSLRLRRIIVWGIVAILVLYFVVPATLRFFGWGNAGETLPATLRVEDTGIVSVMLQGGKSQQAEDKMKLFPQEKLSTGPTGNASLVFFETSVCRLDANTDVTIKESVKGKSSAISLSLERGSLWVRFPASASAPQRSIITPILSYSFPSNAEVILSPTSLLVFRAEGAGITVSFKGHSDITIGEGQQFILPSDLKNVSNDLYSYRSPLDLASLSLPFLLSSREQAGTASSNPTLTSSGTDTLTIDQPAEGATIDASSVKVQGHVGSGVIAVNVNGHPAVLSDDTHSFSQDLAFPAGDTFDIAIRALDAQGSTLAEAHRTVKKGVSASGSSLIAPPSITAPAKTGETYRTQQDEVVLRGTSPANAATIFVNDYQLKLFDPSRGTWSYLASMRLGNMIDGSNVFNVYAVDANGNKSAAAVITILHGPGTEDVVSSLSSSVSSSSPSGLLNLHSLPTNAPLTPGILHVTGAPVLPDFVATGTGFVLEGTTSAHTASMWVNDYQLRLYTPGKTYWNYLASPSLRTIKPGKNVYHIVARDSTGKILDALDFTVTYQK